MTSYNCLAGRPLDREFIQEAAKKEDVIVVMIPTPDNLDSSGGISPGE